MSAIAGVHRTDGGPADGAAIERMLSTLAHRGPDGAAIWAGGGVGLGQAASWTTPEARGERLPLATTAPALVVTADARLDNRAELATALALPGAAGLGDGEMILRAYERWGEGCVARLVGDFAFAIWDARRQVLLCARDHVGTRPLYYVEAGGALLFASEIRALLTSALVPYRLNVLRVADYLVGYFDDPAITFYRDIRRLPPGHVLVAGPAGTRVQRYWSLDATRELRLASDDAYAEAFRECFEEAVRCRLRASGRAGSLLSGGLDSSSIVAMARRIRRREGEGKLHTFTAVFPELPAADLRKIDERAFADMVVAQGGIEPHFVRGDLLRPLGDADRALRHLDEPVSAPNLYLHWALFGAAREQGVGVVLDGIDGDTTVSHGFESLAALARAGRMVALGRELRALSSRYRVPVRRLLWQFGLEPLVPDVARDAARLLRPGRTRTWMADALIKPEFSRSTGIRERTEAGARRQLGPGDFARRAHARAMRSGLITHALETADHAAMLSGVEVRYPFFDRRLMELCLSLPADQKLRGGWTRLVMRRAMDGLLPEEVRWRSTKANLAPNFTRQLRERDRTMLTEIVREQHAVLEEYVDIPALQRAWERAVTPGGSERDALAVFRVATLAFWLQRAKIAP